MLFSKGFIIFWIKTLVVGVRSDYDGCGPCWCIPASNGTAKCPFWKPNEEFSKQSIAAFRTQKPESIFTLDCNPYLDSTCSTTPAQTYLQIDSAVCAFLYSEKSDVDYTERNPLCKNYEYSMMTYSSRENALLAGATVTHGGSCGLCSTTQDLSVYLDTDFTSAGKICATKGLFNETAGLHCYMDLGLSGECAKIWNYDGIFDGTACGKTCLPYLTAPNNGPPPSCSLNPCLECDEELAGPVFSAFAGRTRRRSGLLSEIVRPCDSIYTVVRQGQSCPERY